MEFCDLRSLNLNWKNLIVINHEYLFNTKYTNNDITDRRTKMAKLKKTIQKICKISFAPAIYGAFIASFFIDDLQAAICLAIILAACMICAQLKDIADNIDGIYFVLYKNGNWTVGESSKEAK